MLDDNSGWARSLRRARDFGMFAVGVRRDCRALWQWPRARAVGVDIHMEARTGDAMSNQPFQVAEHGGGVANRPSGQRGVGSVNRQLTNRSHVGVETVSSLASGAVRLEVDGRDERGRAAATARAGLAERRRGSRLGPTWESRR